MLETLHFPLPSGKVVILRTKLGARSRLRAGLPARRGDALPPAEDESAAAAFYGLAVDFRPERGEVIHGDQRDRAIMPQTAICAIQCTGTVTGPKYQARQRWSRMTATTETIWTNILYFAEIAGLDGEALRGGDPAQPADQEFTANDEHGNPGGDHRRVELDQRNQGGGDEEFVGERVEQHAEGGDLSPATRQIAIQAIGDRGGDENQGRQSLFFTVTLESAASAPAT